MRKAIAILWGIVIVGILTFVISVFVANSDETIWRMFSITMPVVGIGFWGAVILSMIDYIRTRNDRDK